MTLLAALEVMVVDAILSMEPQKSGSKHLWMHNHQPSQIHPLSFLVPPLTALFLAIDLQNMESARQTQHTAEDEVVYYVNRDHSGWVEQRVRRRVYIELKLECPRNRKRDV